MPRENDPESLSAGQSPQKSDCSRSISDVGSGISKSCDQCGRLLVYTLTVPKDASEGHSMSCENCKSEETQAVGQLDISEMDSECVSGLQSPDLTTEDYSIATEAISEHRENSEAQGNNKTCDNCGQLISSVNLDQKESKPSCNCASGEIAEQFRIVVRPLDPDEVGFLNPVEENIEMENIGPIADVNEENDPMLDDNQNNNEGDEIVPNVNVENAVDCYRCVRLGAIAFGAVVLLNLIIVFIFLIVAKLNRNTSSNSSTSFNETDFNSSDVVFTHSLHDEDFN